MKKSTLASLSLALITAATATGCGIVSGVVKSELATYAEPTSGDLAHIRLIGSRNVKVYPSTTCPRLDAGGGYPAGPQMGGQRKRDLGMPKTGEEPKHFVEIAARGGEPIVAAFQLGRYEGPRQLFCNVANTFVPETGHNYEVDAKFVGGQCIAMVYEIVPNADGFRRKFVPSRNSFCPTKEGAEGT